MTMTKRFVIMVMLYIFVAVQIMTRLVGFAGESLDMTQEEDVLIIAFDPNLPPYQFYDEGVYKGFLLELSQDIFEKLSLTVRFVPMSVENALKAYDLGSVDMILGLRFDSDLAEHMSFTDPFVTSTISIITPIDNSDMIKDQFGIEPVVIAVESGSTEFEYVKNIKKANFNNAYNQEDVVRLMLMGRADLMIGVRHVAEYLLDSENLTDSYYFSNAYVTPVEYYLAMDKENIKLLEGVNTVLRNLKLTGRYETIYNKWIDDKALESQARIQKILLGMGIVIVLVIAGIMITSLIGIQLKRRVDEKTKELSTANLQLENTILEIKNTNELKNLIFESSPRSIVIFDHEGRVSDMNLPAQVICHLDKAPIGQPIQNLKPLDEMLSGKLEKILWHGASYRDQEFMVELEGKRYFYRYVVYPLPDTKGGIITIEEITEEKLLKERVAEREKNTALIQIVSGIAHEIRNPLTSIKTYAALLPIKKDNEAFQKQISQVVPNEVDRVNGLIENLIDYVKPKARNVERVEVKDLVDSCTLLFQPTVKGHRIRLETHIEGSLYIDVDANQIKQVLINLILNAVDAVVDLRRYRSPEEEVIKISGYMQNSAVVIEVSDTGVGMSSEELSGMFELFYTTKSKGSGIGMTLSKQMIEENKGYLEVESTKLQGTRIRMIFGGQLDG